MRKTTLLSRPCHARTESNRQTPVMSGTDRHYQNLPCQEQTVITRTCHVRNRQLLLPHGWKQVIARICQPGKVSHYRPDTSETDGHYQSMPCQEIAVMSRPCHIRVRPLSGTNCLNQAMSCQEPTVLPKVVLVGTLSKS
jgi:hypothetical protein